MNYKEIQDNFKTQRTKIFTKMFNNVSPLGIYPTTIAYNELDNLLKQSFIKYLQKECESLEKKIDWNNDSRAIFERPEEKSYINGYEHCLQDQITHLQAQIKELEI